MTVLPLFPRRRPRPQVIDLALHRERMTATEKACLIVGRAQERERASRWLRGRADGLELDADRADPPPETPYPALAPKRTTVTQLDPDVRALVWRAVAHELRTAARDLEDPE